MDLDLETIRTVGRASIASVVEFVREIEEADLVLLALPRPTGQLTPMKRLKERHHRLAKLIVDGLSMQDAAAAVDLGYQQVARLNMDPSFRELIKFYRGEVNRQYLSGHEKLGGLFADSVDEMRERVEESGDKIPLGQLLEIAKFAADRTGFGPASSQTNVNVYVGTADRLKAARLKAREASEGQKTIEGVARETSK